MKKSAVLERTDLRSRTLIKAVGDLTNDEFSQCFELTFRGKHRGAGDPEYGLMQGKLTSSKSDPDAYAVMLKDVGGTIVGWGLLFRGYGANHHIYTFVHPDARRMGIGTRLYRSARRKFGPLTSHPWDNRSRGFYSKVEG